VLFSHVALIVIVSGAFESLFIHHGIGWLFDEGWPLYAAMQLHAGGALYDNVFFLFPPGHLLPAWIAYGLDPPGVILARIIYAAFNVALCVAIYGLGRKLMKPPFALLAALLLAVSAPRSHLDHLLFGYRFLVFSALALLAFNRRHWSGDRRWMGVAGLCTGVALCFRLTPAFAVSCGIAVAVLCADRDWPSWLRDLGAYAIGLLAVLVPVLLWFAGGVGIEAVWNHAVLRILPLQSAQSIPLPAMILPDAWDRRLIYEWFVSIQYWLYPLLYAGYAATLGAQWLRSFRQRIRFEHPLLIAVVIWGGVYMARAIGRSDEHHLVTALPPACLVLAHLLSIAVERMSAGADRVTSSRIATWASCSISLMCWIVLQGSDLYLDVHERGVHPLRVLDETVLIRDYEEAERLDRSVVRIRSLSRPDQRVLDLTFSPMIYVLANRRGPGYADVVTPGVFADADHERAFVERLRRDPPALVLWPKKHFDELPSRALRTHAPHLSRWVIANYVRAGRSDRTREIIMVKRR
jgi:hypothetical protein